MRQLRLSGCRGKGQDEEGVRRRRVALCAATRFSSTHPHSGADVDAPPPSLNQNQTPDDNSVAMLSTTEIHADAGTSSSLSSFGNGPRRRAGGARGVVSESQQCRALRKELQATKEELLQTRMALFQSQRSAPKFAEQLLERLTAQDVAAHKAATEMRYTAMALEASMDRLEIDLRRVLSIGLTPDAVDLAAVEAGARHFVRANIGFRAERVSEEPPVAITLKGAEIVTDRTAVSHHHHQGDDTFPEDLTT